MRFHRVLRDVQAGGNLLVAEPVADECDHLLLARGQYRRLAFRLRLSFFFFIELDALCGNLHEKR